jgi:hypothetical protein
MKSVIFAHRSDLMICMYPARDSSSWGPVVGRKSKLLERNSARVAQSSQRSRKERENIVMSNATSTWVADQTRTVTLPFGAHCRVQNLDTATKREPVHVIL